MVWEEGERKVERRGSQAKVYKLVRVGEREQELGTRRGSALIVVAVGNARESEG